MNDVPDILGAIARATSGAALAPLDRDVPTPREHAIALHNRALTVVGEDAQTAYRCAASAVALDEGCADGWRLLGTMLADMKNLPAACACFRGGLRCREGEGNGALNRLLKWKLLINLGHRLMHAGL